MKLFIVKSDDDGDDTGYWAFLTSKGAQDKLAELLKTSPDSQPRILSSVTLDGAVKSLVVGTTLYIFEHEADSEMVFLCAASRSAAESGLNNYYAHKGGAEVYDLDHPLQVTVE